MSRDEAILLDSDCFAREILDLTDEMDEETFAGDRAVQLAVLYEIAVLGEAVKRLSSGFRQEHPRIPWKEIAGTRDKVIHQYDRVKIPVVWQAIAVDIPFLLQQIEPLLPRPES